MLQATLQLDWPVAVDGYQWVDAYVANDDWSLPAKPARMLIHANQAENAPRRWVQPLAAKIEFSAIFRELAVCPPTETGILGFAQRFGTLAYRRVAAPVGIPKSRFAKPKRNNPARVSVRYGVLTEAQTFQSMMLWKQWQAEGAVDGDDLTDWQSTIGDLAALVDIWEALRRDDERQLVTLLQFRRHKSSSEYEFRTPKIAKKYVTDIQGSMGIQSAARGVLWEHLNDRTGKGYSMELAVDHATGAIGFTISPRNLEEAIWLQFAMAVSENHEFRRCEACGDFFRVSPDVAQTHRKLCSDACKQRAHRQRYAKALMLADRRMKPEQIAEQIGASVVAVKRWLKQRKEK